MYTLYELYLLESIENSLHSMKLRFYVRFRIECHTIHKNQEPIGKLWNFEGMKFQNLLLFCSLKKCHTNSSSLLFIPCQRILLRHRTRRCWEWGKKYSMTMKKHESKRWFTFNEDFRISSLFCSFTWIQRWIQSLELPISPNRFVSSLILGYN